MSELVLNYFFLLFFFKRVKDYINYIWIYRRMALEIVLFSAGTFAESVRFAYQQLGEYHEAQVRIFDDLEQLRGYARRINDDRRRLVGMQVNPEIAVGPYGSPNENQRALFAHTYHLFAQRETFAPGSETCGIFFPGLYENLFPSIPQERKVDFPVFTQRLRELTEEEKVVPYRASDVEARVTA